MVGSLSLSLSLSIGENFIAAIYGNSEYRNSLIMVPCAWHNACTNNIVAYGWTEVDSYSDDSCKHKRFLECNVHFIVAMK